MLTVGDRFPDYRLKAVVGLAPGKEFAVRLRMAPRFGKLG